jgi:adenylate cyclase
LDAKDGTHLWAETYDRELSASSVFTIQDEISEQVVAAIAGAHGVISQARFAEIKEKPTESLDAYECVLRYTAYNRGNYAVSEHARLRDALEDAVKSDSNYAEAWACLCAIYLDEHLSDYNARPDPLGRAMEAARRAVAADPFNQAARFVLAYVHFYCHDIGQFLTEGERAISLNPSNSMALELFGDCLQQSGNESGIAYVRKALALDPFHPTWYYFPIAHHHFERGEFEEALGAARRIDVPDYFLTQVYLAAINAELGHERAAQSAVQELLRISPGFNLRKLIEERRKWNATDESIRRWVAALRKAGLPEETEA